MTETVRELIRAQEAALTRAERQLAAVLMSDYPVSGLGPIAQLAQRGGVSAPTVVRMVQKLGFDGFAAFQAALRTELAERMSSPIAKQERWAGEAPEGHILNRFSEAVLGNIRHTLNHVDPEQFDATAALMADTGRRLFIAGGRITSAMAHYLHLHMQVIRPDVTHIQAMSNAWPHSVLDMGPGDVLVIYDIRRYENAALKLAEIAQTRQVRIILFTDQWRSPISRLAQATFSAHVEAPSAWDSTVALMLMSETLIAAVQERAWERTRARMNELEGIFDTTRMFRKFV